MNDEFGVHVPILPAKIVGAAISAAILYVYDKFYKRVSDPQP